MGPSPTEPVIPFNTVSAPAVAVELGGRVRPGQHLDARQPLPQRGGGVGAGHREPGHAVLPDLPHQQVGVTAARRETRRP